MKKKKQKSKDINLLKNKSTIIFIIFISLFILLSILVLTNNTLRLDNYFSSLIIDIRKDSLTNKMCTITQVGGAYSLIAISLLLVVFIKRKKISLLIIINLITVFLTNQLFKIIFSRPRPDGVFLSYANGYSYPSGHSMVNISYFIFIIYLIHKYIDNKLIKVLLYITLSCTIILVGFSRIYLGMHYFTDVIGGYLLGTCYSIFFISLVKKKGYIS